VVCSCVWLDVWRTLLVFESIHRNEDTLPCMSANISSDLILSVDNASMMRRNAGLWRGDCGVVENRRGRTKVE
jgi:hypothetical protein